MMDLQTYPRSGPRVGSALPLVAATTSAPESNRIQQDDAAIKNDISLTDLVEQQPAFETLKGRTNEELRTYLGFSDQELVAIQALRRLIRSTGRHRYLHGVLLVLTVNLAAHKDRHLSQSSLQSYTSFSSASALSTSSSGFASLKSCTRSSTSTVELQNPIVRHGSGYTPSSSFGQKSSQSDQHLTEEGSNPSSPPTCSYWCTVCEEPRHYKTCGGWVKHEKERHEGRIHVCMPDGAIVLRGNALVCVFCGGANPDENHLKEHNALPCLRKALAARTYNRLYQFENHLESHGVRKGSAIAKEWRRDCQKKAWACGFCVAYFKKSSMRFNHIATQHYERGDDLSKWDPTKVILGLLQQPNVHKAWRERINLQFPGRDVELRWGKAPTGSLISLLELGPSGTENGFTLAMEAFMQSDYWLNHTESLPIPTVGSKSSHAAQCGVQTNLGDRKPYQHRTNNSCSSGSPERTPAMPVDLLIQPSWLQDQSDCVCDVAISETQPGHRAPSELPGFAAGQSMRSSVEDIDFSATQIHPIQETELSQWPAATTTQVECNPQFEAGLTEYSWSNTLTDDSGFTNSSPAPHTVRDLANFGTTNDDPPTSIMDMLTKFSPISFGVLCDRPLSPMNLDEDLVART